MRQSPESIARHTVEQNGGSYTTDVADLIGLFGRKHLTDKARRDVRVTFGYLC